jgi:hypothetical protein
LFIIVLLSNKMTIARARKLAVKGCGGERKKYVKNDGQRGFNALWSFLAWAGGASPQSAQP